MPSASSELFGKIGKMKGEPYKIRLKEDAVPFHISTPRRIAIPLMRKVKKNLDDKEEQGIIVKVKEPTKWCSPISVVMKKNGDVRICVDLRQLNRSVKRERYMLPTFEDVT